MYILKSLLLQQCPACLVRLTWIVFVIGGRWPYSWCLVGHCWRSRDELIRDVLLWIPTHGRAKAGRPARTYIQQLCEDTGCCPEDLPRAMNDREEWRERVRDIRATSAIWWWWHIKNFCYVYITTCNGQYRKSGTQERFVLLKQYALKE